MGGCKDKCAGCGRVCCDLSWQFLLIFVQVVGVCFSIVVVAGCRFYEVTYTWSVPPLPGNLPNITGLGLFTYERTVVGESSHCEQYDGSAYENYIDDPIRIGALFSAVAFGLGFVGLCVTVLSLFLLCCVDVKGFKWIIGAFFMVATICQGLTFLATATEVCWKYDEARGVQAQCRMASSAYFSIAAVIMHFWAGVQSCAMSWPEEAFGKARCCRACCGDREEEEDAEKKVEDEEEGGGKDAEAQEAAPEPQAAPEEDPDAAAAAAAAAGAAGGAAVAAAAGDEEEEKEEVSAGDAQDEIAAEAAAAAREDVKASVKSNFSEAEDDDDGSSFSEAEEDDNDDVDDEEEGGGDDERGEKGGDDDRTGGDEGAEAEMKNEESSAKK